MVSILLVTYNAERYIGATLRSCLNQTYSNIELLILDNASTDRTVTIITEIRDSRVTVVHQSENIGPYAGLNVLLQRAKGSYIAIQDHDDLWLPTKIERQIHFLKGNNDYVACGTLTYYYFEDRQTLVIPKNSLDTDFVDHTSLMFRRGTVSYQPTRALPDEHFERKALKKYGKIRCLQEPLTVHRIRDDKKNLSSHRVHWNMPGAWEHLQLTKYRDLPGSLLMIFAGSIPSQVLWFIRRKITLRNAKWLDKKSVASEPALQALLNFHR